MRRYVYLLLAVSMVLSACGPEAGEAALAAEEGPEVESSQAAIVMGPLPILTTPVLISSAQLYIPQQPAVLDLTNLNTMFWPTRFFPSTSRSAYTIIYNFSGSPETFYAFGFDVKGYRTAFIVRGTSTQKPAFMFRIGAELQSLASASPSGEEVGRQIDVRIPPSPTPQVHEDAVSAWNMTKNQYMADVSQALVYTPTKVYQLQP